MSYRTSTIRTSLKGCAKQINIFKESFGILNSHYLSMQFPVASKTAVTLKPCFGIWGV